MNNLPQSLVKQASSYLYLSNDKKYELIHSLYNKYNMSYADIAELADTYPNKIIRDAKKLGIKSKSRSEAQKIALSTGKHPHPTKGTERSKDVKEKISEGVAKSWDRLSHAEKEKRRQDAVKRWNEKTPEEIREFRRAAGEGVRRAAKEGSALEKHLLKELVRHGYKTEFHKEQWVIKDRLQIDLFLPELNIAIEVDGPSHFDDIWGEENLAKNQQRDNEKNGLLLQRGCCIIRIKHKKSTSQKYMRDITEELLDLVLNIEDKFPEHGNRIFVIGDNE